MTVMLFFFYSNISEHLLGLFPALLGFIEIATGLL